MPNLTELPNIPSSQTAVLWSIYQLTEGSVPFKQLVIVYCYKAAVQNGGKIFGNKAFQSKEYCWGFFCIKMAQTQYLWFSCYSNWKKIWYISEFESKLIA